MKLCSISDCKNYAMTNIDVCDTHRRELKKAERLAAKPVKKPKAIPKESPKRKKERPIYNSLAKQYLAEHPECEAKLPGCEGESMECHHSAKRGSNYLNVSTFMALCSSCHRITEQELSASVRKSSGLLKRVDLNRDVERNII